MDRKKNSLEIGTLIKRLEIVLTTKNNNCLREFNITWSQAHLLQHLVEQEELTKQDGKERPVFQKDIETYFNLTNPTITGIVNRLEEKGLLTRETVEHDRRWRRLRLTDKGRTLEKDIYKMCQKLNADLMQQFSDEEISAYVSSLERLFEAINSKKK